MQQNKNEQPAQPLNDGVEFTFISDYFIDHAHNENGEYHPHWAVDKFNPFELTNELLHLLELTKSDIK